MQAFSLKVDSLLAESFYNVKNRSSFITSKSSSKNLSNEKNTSVFVVFKTKREAKCQWKYRVLMFDFVTKILSLMNFLTS